MRGVPPPTAAICFVKAERMYHPNPEPTDGRKIAVIENEFGDTAIDDALVSKEGRFSSDEEIIPPVTAVAATLESGSESCSLPHASCGDQLHSLCSASPKSGAMGGGDGKLKRQASRMQLTDIPQIVKDLKAAPYEAKEKFVHLMDVIAVQQDKNPGVLVQAGAVKPLVELLTSGNDGSQIYSASTLATIAASKQEYQIKIIEAGAIAPLVTLLRMGSNKAQLFAAAAIAELSEQRAQQDPIVKAGAVVPIVRLLRGGGDATEDAHLHAADAVANLSDTNPKAQKAFFDAGVVPLLLAQLYSGRCLGWAGARASGCSSSEGFVT